MLFFASSFRPLIAITRPNKSRKWVDACLIAAVWLGGGRPFLLKPRHDYKTCAFDGLVLSGGTDVHPKAFHQKPKENYAYDLDRDDLERFMFDKACKVGKPVLGICRGAQMINVARGGSLVMDITDHLKCLNYPENPYRRIFFRKDIVIDPHSHLHRIWGVRATRVNSFHTQCVNDLGVHLKIVAREPSNHITQAIEDERHAILGVQFHPEYMLWRRDSVKIFKWLVGHARRAPKTQ